MPYSIVRDHKDCDGFGVVKDDDNKLMGCHDSKEKANKQITALNIAESESDGYRQVDPNNDIYKTKDEAEAKAQEIGCVGSHTHEIEGVIYYMPCEKMSEYEELTGMKHSSEEDYTLTERHDIKVPAFIKNNASRGLENLQFAGQGLTEKTKREARMMRDGDVSHDKALRMAAWFARHVTDLQGEGAKEFLAGETDRMSPGQVAWLLWGGSLAAATRMDAMRWAERQVARHEGEKNSRPQPVLQSAGIIKAMSESKETRYFELRAEAAIDSEDLVFTGYASVFNSPYSVADSRGVYNEIVNPGAFSKTLNEQDDVKFLINHDGIPLARTKSGTLELREDEHGLFVKAELDEANPRVAEISSALKRGDLSEMSFGFHAIKDEFTDGGETRTLKELRLLDVSVVTWPANPATVGKIRGVDLGELQSTLAEVRNDEATIDQADKIKEVIGQLSDLLPSPESSKSKVRAAVRDIEVWDLQSRS